MMDTARPLLPKLRRTRVPLLPVGGRVMLEGGASRDAPLTEYVVRPLVRLYNQEGGYDRSIADVTDPDPVRDDVVLQARPITGGDPLIVSLCGWCPPRRAGVSVSLVRWVGEELALLFPELVVCEYPTVAQVCQSLQFRDRRYPTRTGRIAGHRLRDLVHPVVQGGAPREGEYCRERNEDKGAERHRPGGSAEAGNKHEQYDAHHRDAEGPPVLTRDAKHESPDRIGCPLCGSSRDGRPRRLLERMPVDGFQIVMDREARMRPNRTERGAASRAALETGRVEA